MLKVTYKAIEKQLSLSTPCELCNRHETLAPVGGVNIKFDFHFVDWSTVSYNVEGLAMG
jgi:hypothetical protein